MERDIRLDKKVKLIHNEKAYRVIKAQRVVGLSAVLRTFYVIMWLLQPAVEGYVVGVFFAEREIIVCVKLPP